ncbi:MAG: sialate O-acetylesterase [Oscillospiraceae bacterium]|nr:sialate O-acetylesterase [Oscillospiraceae bacterium]
MTHSFLLIGQSNAGGRGEPSEVAPIENDDGKLVVLRNGRWRKLYTPVNADRATSGVCLAESFAAAYRDDHPEADQIGIIPCADGGSRLDQWMPGMLLYDHVVLQARLALRTSNIVGILWHQGESDCRQERWKTYADKFRVFSESLRRDLALENVPLLIGGLGDYLAQRRKLSGELTDHALHYRDMNAVLQHLGRELENTAFVPADGLADKGDHLHFSAKSLREFGLRYYAAFKTLEDRNRIWQEKPTLADLEGEAESSLAEL